MDPSQAPRPLTDSFGRVHRDLRIAVTDRCNYRCTYCMPEEGLEWLAREQLLTYEELARLARLFVEHYGIDSIRLTGGEPTVRHDLPVLVEQLAALNVDLALTTNGSKLRALAPKLVAAGLKRINISCDSLRADRFEQITKRDDLPSVLDGIDAAIEAGLHPVKLNSVVMRGLNDDELVDFATFGRERGVTVRFIEFMPLDAQGAWTNAQVVTQAEILETIGAVYPLEPLHADDGVTSSEPASRFRFLDGRGEIGVIPSVTNAFCESCDRVRLTADGTFRTCLFALDDHDLRTPLRAGATDDELCAIIERAVGAKWAGHQINQVQFIRPKRSMSQIGG